MEPQWFQIDSSRGKLGSYIVQRGYTSRIVLHNDSIPPSTAVFEQSAYYSSITRLVGPRKWYTAGQHVGACFAFQELCSNGLH